MPPLTRWFIKTAFVYLVATLVIGLALAADRIWSVPSFISALSPIYFHLFMVGWVLQLISGATFLGESQSNLKLGI